MQVSSGNRSRSGIAFEVRGDGPPLVLHPGMFQVGEHWARSGYTEALTSTHTVITMDPLGHGGSDAPHEPAAYTLERRAESVTAVLDEIGVDRATYWGYSLGALTGYAVAVHAPQRLTRLVAGGFDPVGGFRSAVAPMFEHLGLPPDTDPYPMMRESALADPDLAPVVEGADPEALRANYVAFLDTPGPGAELTESGVPMLLYAGTADLWYQPIREFAERTDTPFVALPDMDHVGQWSRSVSSEVLARVLPFLTGAGPTRAAPGRSRDQRTLGTPAELAWRHRVRLAEPPGEV